MATKPPLHRIPGGMLNALREDPLGMIEAMVARDEPLLRGRIGPIPQWAVFDADLARDVLSAHADDYPRPFLVNAIFRGVSGTNVFTTHGPAWSWRRKALQPPFQRAPIERLAPTVEAIVEREVDALAPGQLADAQTWFSSVTIAVASAALFSYDLPADERQRLDGDFRDVVEWVGRLVRTVVPLPVWVPTAANRKVRAANTDIRAWIAELVARRRSAGVGGRGDALDAILTMTDPATGQPLDDDRVADEIIVLLFAGYETSAASLCWAVAYLAERPDLQARIAAGDPDLAERVVNETLRLRPAGWGAPRMAARTTNLGGHRIRRYTPVVVSVYGIHRNPRYWPDPDRFDPDRFLPDQLKTRPAGAFLPFIVGPRHCLGMRLAQMEMRLVVESLCRRFELETLGPVEPDATFTLRVRGALPLELIPRAVA
jgi:cytochrome P450